MLGWEFRQAAVMDRISPKARSRIMSRIQAKDTKPELVLRRALWKSGLRGYRLHCMLPGRPDIVYPSKKVAIFVDGDFWHGYLWKVKNKIPPKKYWQAKIHGNILRDQRVTRKLSSDGWEVLRFWEHDINENIKEVVSRISFTLNTSLVPD